MLLVGLILSGLTLLGLGLGWVLFPDQTLMYAAMTGLNLLIGRAAGMSFGYASGLGHEQVIPVNIIVETVQVLVIYPLFVLSWNQLLDVPRIKPFLARMHGTASARRGVVSQFGIVGLFVFVFIPFWMTGPVVGSIIGFLIGLRPMVNISVVLIATYVAIGAWALLLNELSGWAATYNRYAPYALVLALALILIGGYLLRWQRERSARQRD